MKAALLIVLSLSALAMASPAFNKNNQINEADKANQQHMTTDYKSSSQAVEILKQWCFSSQMSQPELTASFKKLVSVVKSAPVDQTTESAVMSERICQGALVQKSQQTGETVAKGQADAQAHELIKDVYMDALIACEARECTQQLVKIINSNQVDTIRASYYMTRIAVTEKESIKDESEIKLLADAFISQSQESHSEAVERQKLFAITSLIGKWIKSQPQQSASSIKPIAEQVAKTIVERYIKPVGQQEVQQYKEQPEQQSAQVAKKIAKRSAAIKALCNIPGHLLKEIPEVEQTLIQIADNKQELVTVRQSAIECLEQNEQAEQKLTQITFDQEEPTEVRIAAYRALMTMNKQQTVQQTIEAVIKHCEESRNQQQDNQFVLYVISHLDNIRASQQPEHKLAKEIIAENKQHFMQIQLLCKKFKSQLSDVTKSSRNVLLSQQFNQIESGLVLEGDIIYQSAGKKSQQQILPKLIRVNMSMPVMGETVNVVEITVRQNQMDEDLMGALKLVQGAKFNSESVSKVVDSFKSTVEKRQQNTNKDETAEADLTIKVDGCTVVYLCVDDFKSGPSMMSHQRNTRSVYSSASIVDEIIEHLKRSPVNFNRGFNFNLNQRIAKLLDIEANIIAGLRFESRASGQSSSDFEIVARVEPRLGLEAIVGPAKMSSKKLLQRVSTKSALGLRLKYKSNELVDVQIELPMNTMELFTFETQLVEKNTSSQMYSYLPESIYGQEEIYSSKLSPLFSEDSDSDFELQQQQQQQYNRNKRSIFDNKKSNKSIFKFIQGKSSSLSAKYETPEEVARATGLRAQIRYAVSPKDMSVLVQAVAQKYEPRMTGYRLQVQKVRQGGEQKQYIVTVSTPNSTIDRTMQVRLYKQSNSQRTTLKGEIQSPKMGATILCELTHDGRLFAVKTELASTRKQWRHTLEAGVQRQSAGRVAGGFALKPYLSVSSSELRRPLQLQGVVNYQESPKSVISYELKCPTSGDFVQGKIILDARQSSLGKRSMSLKRSMRSPVELVLGNDLTLSSEMVAQVQQQALKVHNMIDWDAQRWSLTGDMSLAHKNIRKSSTNEFVANMKLDENEQTFTIQRKCPQQERKEFRVVVSSISKISGEHQMVAELRRNDKRQSPSVLAYKHQMSVKQISGNKLELVAAVELIDSERQISEKITGRGRFGLDRHQKSAQVELSSRAKQLKMNVDFQSWKQHQIELQFQGERYQHKSSIRANQRQLSFQSRTDKRQQMLAKVVFELMKAQNEAQFVIELPTERCHLAADLKLSSGKLSSLAVQTPRFASKAEFSFEKLVSGTNSVNFFKSLIPATKLRFSTDLKDLVKQEAYWMESAYNGVNSKSFLRMDSPVYRSELEFDPSEEMTKFGAFARSKRSVNSFNELYSTKESPIYSQMDLADKMNLASKLWQVRSIVSSPYKMESLKEKARRALFEYADRSQQHKHQINWSPVDERVNFSFEHQPSSTSAYQWQPRRLSGDLTTSFVQQQQPSTVNFESEWIDMSLDAQPFGAEESYAKISALSRHRRSSFKKHESEIRHKKGQGYSAWMKHEDSKNKRHSAQLEADESPKKWTKMSFESDKHGKGQYEHKWRQHAQKRSHPMSLAGQEQQDEVYANKVQFSHQKPSQKFEHQTSFEWEEPTGLKSNQKYWSGRVRRDITGQEYGSRRFSTLDYLKHTSARLQSATNKNQANLFNVDFDYQPSNFARLNVATPDELLHAASLEYEPTERTYKLQSKAWNRLTPQVSSYEFLAATKPVVGEQEQQMFIDESHPMLARPVGRQSLVASLFRQPLKFDYTDKFGRVARFDYDQSPLVSDRYNGLRQKRAAVYYKDEPAQFEHSSSFDFYPESLIAGGFNSKQSQQPGEITMKASTKYGPVVVRVDSDDKITQIELESPVASAKLSGEQRAQGAKLIKFQLDNKSQQVQLSRLLRKSQLLNDFELIQELARQFDQGKFEHQTELLVDIVDVIYKIKSVSQLNKRPVMVIEGELNKQQEKAVIKIDGKKTQGQLVVDWERQSAELMVNVDEKRTMEHVTRIVRLNDKFYSVESQTSYKQQPLYKLVGKLSSYILSEPEHLLSRRASSNHQESSFVADIFQPKRMTVSGTFDCCQKEGRVVVKNMDDKRVQETNWKFDELSDSIIVESRLNSAYGQIYATKAKLNLTGLFEGKSNGQCRRQPQSCQSEFFYANKSGNWMTKYVPGEYIAVNTPVYKQTINMVY